MIMIKHLQINKSLGLDNPQEVDMPLEINL